VAPDPTGVGGDLIAELEWPAIFATVGGAHLYGFASAASDLQLRAVHLLPVRELVGAETGAPTLEITGQRDGVQFDLVSYELSTFGRMLIKPNGYVLEHLLSPLVVTTTAVHLFMLRLALASAHLMRTGGLVANLDELSAGHDLPYVPELIAAKIAASQLEALNDLIVRVHLESG